MAQAKGMRQARLTRPRLEAAARQLAQRDRDLASILERLGPPPLWALRPGYPTLLRIILEQQVSLASARHVFNRIASEISPLTPARVLASGEAGLRALGLTRQKAAYCVNAAEAVMDGKLDFPSLARMSDDEVRAELTRVKGVGPWTAEVYLLRVLSRPDSWPSGDLAIATALRRLKRLRGHPSPERLDRIANVWRPFRAVAARMLWQYYLAARGRKNGTTG